MAWVDPNYDRVSKANEKYRKDKFASAQKEYEKLLPKQKGKNKAITHYNMANSYLKQKQFKQALQHYNEAAKYNDKVIRQKSYNNMGITYAKMGKTKAALESYLSALNEGNNPEIRRNIERLFRKQKDQNKDKQDQDQNQKQNQKQKKKNQSGQNQKKQNEQSKSQQSQADTKNSEEKKKLAERIIREASRNKVQRRHGKGGGSESKPY